MTDDETQAGGPDWERNEAAKRLAAAVQAGDAQAIEEAADRLGDAVVNATASRLIPTLEKTLASVVAPEFKRVERWHTSVVESFGKLRTDDYTRWYESDQQTRAAVRALGTEIDQAKRDTVAAVQEVAVAVGKTQDDITAIVERMDARDTLNDERYEDSQEFERQSLEDRDRLNKAITDLAERLEAYIAGSRRGEVDTIKEWVAQIQSYLDPDMTPEKAREQQQRYIEMIERHEAELQRIKAEKQGDGG